MEGFYQLEWEETVIDPVGSYFSTTDYVGPGAREAVIVDPRFEGLLEHIGSDVDLGFGFGPLTAAINQDLPNNMVDHPQFGRINVPHQPPVDPDFMTVLRGPDRDPEDSGQWGLALRYLAEDLNSTEFGLYFANYHSRLPLLRARTGSLEGIQAGLVAAGAVAAPTSFTFAALRRAVILEVTARVQAGLIDPADAPNLIMSHLRERASGVASALAIDRYAKTGHFFHEYPENVQLLGLSFNTALGTSGWALQGDYALHLDAPLQRAERVLIEEGLEPVTTGLGLAGCESNPGGELCPRHPVTGDVLPSAYFHDLLNQHLLNHEPVDVRGYVRRDVSQIQATATKVFGPVLGADALAFVTEAAVMHVHSMTDDPLEGPARASSLDDPKDADADATSWGYRMAARLDYNNAIGAVNLFPYVQWRHDVDGNSPAPSGSFSEDLTALTLGLRADYLNSWRAKVAYTRYGGRRNTLRDRDFISASINYSF